MHAFTSKERTAIANARHSVQRIVASTPDCLAGDELVAKLMYLLLAEGPTHTAPEMAAIALAAAAIAELVEQGREERSVTA